MMLRLGNTLADGTKTFTEVGPFPEDTSLAEAVQIVDDLWRYHALSDQDEALVTDGQRARLEHPTAARWVASDSAALASVVAEMHSCDVRQLEV